MKILVALDGSTFAEQAIPLAQHIARTPGAEVYLLTVIDPGLVTAMKAAIAEAAPSTTSGRLLTLEQDAAAFSETTDSDVESVLGHYLDAVARQFPDCVVRPVVRVGPYPAEQIAAYAEANGIDLVVMATHGRSGLSKLLHGSVAEQVLRSGVAPVALIRPMEAA